MKKSIIDSIKVYPIDDKIYIESWQNYLDLTHSEARKLINKIKSQLPKSNKYGSKKVQAYGRLWDSQMELDFYEYLRNKFGAEKVIIQPKFVLQESFKQDDKLVRAITYAADFEIYGLNLVYDVKGMVTQQGKMRIKMFKAKYPDLSLQLITKCPKKYQLKYGEWIEVSDLEKDRKLAKKAVK